MAYITGAVTSLADLLAAVQSACTVNGWTLSGQVLRKGNCYTRLAIVGADLQVLGGTGIDGSNALTTPGPQLARVGATAVPAVLTFPLTYYIHIQTSPDEVYVCLNFSVNRWQWFAFGCSPAQGIPGTGGWYSASSSAGSGGANIYITPGTACGYNQGACVSGGLFAQNGSWTVGWMASSYIHHGLDGLGWSNANSFAQGVVGDVDAWTTVQPLLARQPNTWNGETALLPIQPVARRASNKVSLVGQITHARYIRNDNLADGELITLGNDRWKSYPFVQKNSAARDGSSTNHSGTLGMAIRYDGP